ncbi:MAG TPA: hypothetical protein VN397_01430 [Candidatus Methylomirabilis sp.]|nr:hypothetical protein [Candidatus Methylomirabilis sp.]
MQRPRIFFDLDHTLYDTDAMLSPIVEDAVRLGASENVVRTAIRHAGRTGFTFEAVLARLGHPPDVVEQRALVYRQRLAEGNAFLYPGVTESLQRIALRADCVLLTYGYPPFQEEKFSSVTDLHPVFLDRHFVWAGQTKGDVIRSYGDDRPAWFVDDAPEHLEDALQKAPWTMCIRMSRCVGESGLLEEDRRWYTATSFESIERLLGTQD